MATQLGADHVIDIDSVDLMQAVADITGGQMADLVIDCASGGPDSVNSAIALARKKGRVILGGQKRQTIPNFNSDRIIANFLTVKGMRGHSYQSVELAMQLIASNRYGVQSMSTHVFKLNQTDLALRSLIGQGVDENLHMTVNPWD
jgi:threonine dehydrogenase-like Zn-dependent dehydrogenase